MSKFWKAAAVVVLFVGAAPLGAQATCTTNGCSIALNASAAVPDLLSLTLSSTTQDLGAPTAADFTTGYKDAAGPTATVKSNRPWHVDVAAAAANFSYSGALTNPNKPASDLLWGTAAGTYGKNAGTSAALFNGSGTGGSSQAIFFRTNWNWATDVAGTYTLAINFTLAAP